MTTRDSAGSQRFLGYLDAILKQDAAAASLVIEELLREGLSPIAIYLDILARAQEKVGELWADGKVNIAEEHWATEATFAQMEKLRRTLPAGSSLGFKAIVAGVAGNQHSLGGRMVADFLTMDGWEVDFLGANMPADDLVAHVQRRDAKLVALSIALEEHLPVARETVAALRKADPEIRILAGGLAVSSGSGGASVLECDAIAADALDASVQARKLAGLGGVVPLERYLITLGTRIQQLRRARSWSQMKLAEAAGLDRAYISSVENGKQNLTIGALKRLADALDVPLERLLNLQTAPA